jgi:hypothetical protein
MEAPCIPGKSHTDVMVRIDRQEEVTTGRRTDMQASVTRRKKPFA